MTTILSDAGTFQVSTTDGLRLGAIDAARITGWTLKPEGMCRGDECVPLAADAIRGNVVDVQALWRRLDAPVLHDDLQSVWVLGADAGSRRRALADGIAPDFTLPDLAGKLHTLSALRGRKVFLATWASW